MELRREYSWVAFALAALCASLALWFVIRANQQAGTSPPVHPSPSFTQPDYVPAAPPVTVPPPPATAAPAPAPGSVLVPTGLVQVYPGGWVWNPTWTDGRWDGRWRDSRRNWDRPREWDRRFARETDWSPNQQPWMHDKRRR